MTGTDYKTNELCIIAFCDFFDDPFIKSFQILWTPAGSKTAVSYHFHIRPVSTRIFKIGRDGRKDVIFFPRSNPVSINNCGP